VLDETSFVAIADDDAGARVGELPRAALGVTTSGHDHGLRLLPSGTAHGTTGIGVTRAGDGAGVDDIDVGVGVEGDDLISTALKIGAEGLGFVLIQLTPDMLYGDT
jgi:hypothetical protein